METLQIVAGEQHPDRSAGPFVLDRPLAVAPPNQRNNYSLFRLLALTSGQTEIRFPSLHRPAAAFDAVNKKADSIVFCLST